MMKSGKVIGLIVKLLILTALIMAGVFVYMTCSGGSCVQRIDNMPPDVTKAAWETPTPTKIYYSEKAEKQTNGDVILFNWYEPIGKKWVYHSGYETLPRDIYGKMSPRRR